MGMDVRRLLLAISVALVGGAGVVTGVGVEDGDGDGPTLLAPRPARVSVSYQPAEGGPPVSPTSTIRVTVTDGELREVALTPAGGAPVKGTLAPDRRSWAPAEPLRYGTTYAWSGAAADAEGKTVPIAGNLTTVTPSRQVRATINIGDGRTVGIATPVQIQFSGRVVDRAAVERALTVTTSVANEGSWGWLQDEGGGSRVHYRTKDYWKRAPRSPCPPSSSESPTAAAATAPPTSAATSASAARRSPRPT